MGKVRVFTSFDFDHDEDLRNFLVGQSRHPDSPFEMADRSVKVPLVGDWKAKVRTRLRRVDLMIVICGHYSDRAGGINAEISIAREQGVPYFLLAGRREGTCKKPTAARASDKMVAPFRQAAVIEACVMTSVSA